MCALVGMQLNVIASCKEHGTGQVCALASNTTSPEACGLVTIKGYPKWNNLVDWSARATIIAVDMGIEQKKWCKISE